MTPLLSDETKEFVLTHRHEDARKLAFKSPPAGVDLRAALQQIEGYQLAQKKLPTWAQAADILFPVRLSLEQCSSEATALAKVDVARALVKQCGTMVDLTGGFGVDCSYLATLFEAAAYVEQQEELCQLAKHNLSALNLPHVKVNHTDGVAYLHTMQPVDFIFIDPARRDHKGHKTVAIADCEPNLCALEEELTQKGGVVMAKLSPMLDIHQAIQALKTVRSVHIVSLQNECKELLLILSREEDGVAPQICCTMLLPDGSTRHLEFTFEQERNTQPTYATALQTYLYEPDAALMKAGCFKYLACYYSLEKLHLNSHLYTSQKLVEDFPGRTFRILKTYRFSKGDLKALKSEVPQANITLRNFPATTDVVRKQLKLKEGGDDYLFVTTGAADEKMIIHCRKG